MLPYVFLLLFPSPSLHFPFFLGFGFIDVLLKHKESKEYYIIDFKTSRGGWTKDMKKDKTKINQLLLYKYFLSIQYKIDIEKIKVPRLDMGKQLIIVTKLEKIYSSKALLEQKLHSSKSLQKSLINQVF